MTLFLLNMNELSRLAARDGFLGAIEGHVAKQKLHVERKNLLFFAMRSKRSHTTQIQLSRIHSITAMCCSYPHRKILLVRIIIDFLMIGSNEVEEPQ
jgi:hypothetical protein